MTGETLLAFMVLASTKGPAVFLDEHKALDYAVRVHGRVVIMVPEEGTRLRQADRETDFKAGVPLFPPSDFQPFS